MWKKIKANYQSYILPLVCISFYVFLNFITQEFSVVSNVLNTIMNLVSPFLVGFGFAFLLVKPMHFIEKLYAKIIPHFGFRRVLSVLSVLFLAIVLLIGITILIIPQLIQSILNLEPILIQLNTMLKESLSYIKHAYDLDLANLLAFSNIKDLFETLRTTSDFNALEIVNRLLMMSTSTLKMVLNLLISIICAMYLLIDKEKFSRYIKKANYALFSEYRAQRNYEITLLAKDIFNNFIIGKIIDSIIIGILCYIGMVIFKFEYALLISFFVGVTNVIPVFGPFIGGIPGVIILFIINPVMGMWFALFIFLLQQFDGNILGPYILGDKLGLPSLGILISVVIGGGLFGFMGMLLGVPVFALFFELSKQKLNKKLKDKQLEIE